MKKLIFLKEFLNKKGAFPFFEQILFRGVDYRDREEHREIPAAGLVLIRDVPDYFNVRLRRGSGRLLRVRSQEGYFIDLSQYSDYTGYTESVRGPKSRSNLRRYTHRLEQCFSIQHIVYWGFIDRDEYHRLFEVLRQLLVRRFQEKKESNYELPYLQEFEDSLYELIHEKKASLFVIYDGNKPISIRINIFRGPLAYYIMSGYDIDYARFHPGLIDMSKNIEWLLENKFEIYDLLKGYKAYKSKWYTHTYFNNHYIVPEDASASTFLRGRWLFATVLVKEVFLRLIRHFRINIWLKRGVKSLDFKWNKPCSMRTIPKSKWASLAGAENRVAIDIEEDQSEYRHLRKDVYDFLFRTKSDYDKTEIYKHRKMPVFHIRSDKDETFIEADK